MIATEPEQDVDPSSEAELKTPMQYRRHVVGWLKEARTVDDVAARWAADAELRESCEASLEDVLWLGTLAEPILRDLRMKDGLSRADVAGAWARHGVDEAPWRT